MASVKNLKKDINNVLGDVIGAVCDWELDNTDSNTKKSEAIIDEAIDVFDDLIAKVNAKDVDNAKAHFKAINNELEEKAQALIDKVNNLK